MSAFAVCFNKKGSAISKDIFLPIHAALQHYSIDDSRYIIDDVIAFSYHSFWTTPEEQGEQQPIKFAGRYWFVWDGRIDNREEIYQSLSNERARLEDLSDAQLLLNVYLEKGIASLKEVIGPYAWTLYDKEENTLIAARDSMGARYLVYAETDEWCCVASTVHAITAHPDFSFQINQRLVAQHFSFNYTNEDSTFCENIKLVLPGHYLKIAEGKSINQHEFYLPDPNKRIRYTDHREYHENFKQLLSAAVSARLRSTTSVASMLSGGLDSSPITIEAANLIDRDKKLYGVTWTFDELKECDERAYLDDIYNDHEVLPVWVNCDDAYPLNPQDSWPINPDIPFDYPYRGKHLRAYQVIKDKNCRVTLSGMAGDDLYSGTELIAYEYLQQLRFLEIYRELKHRFRYEASLGIFLRKHFLWYTKLWFSIKGRSPYWAPHITEQAFNKIQGDNSFLGNRAKYALRPRQYDTLIGTYYSNPLSNERFFSTPYQTEIRYPMRDRRLVEFMLQIPSEHLYSNNVTRPIIRKAFCDVLPEKIKDRKSKTSFHLLLKKLEQEKLLNKDMNDHSNWSHYVKSSWISDLATPKLKDLVVKWQAIYWELWVEQRKK